MESIYIIGSGGLAKEVHFLIEEINKREKAYEFKGFIDYEPTVDSVVVRNRTFPVISENLFLADRPETCVVIGVGDPRKISKIVQKFKGFKFPNLIHPSFIGDQASIKIGEGNVIAAGNVFTVDIEIGSYNVFNYNLTVGHDTKIGSMNVFNPGCNISGGVDIGNNTLIGANATILQYLAIGSSSIIGAGAVVNKNIEPFKLAVGVPAKVIKELN